MTVQTSSQKKALYELFSVLPPEATPPISDAVRDFLVSKTQSGRRAIYVQSLRDYMRIFIRGREQKRIGEFTMIDIEQWFAARSECPASRNSNIGRLSALFNWAWRRGYLMQNPCSKIEPMLVETSPPEILSVEQCKTALRWTAEKEPRFLAWLTLALLVGLRPESEADIITWEDIHLDRSIIRIDGSKTKTRRHRLIDLGMMPRAVVWLQLAKDLNGCEELPTVHMARRRYIKRLQDRLGLPEWPQDLLRHTAASYLFARHQDAGLVATFLGNSASVLLRRYRALVERRDAEKFLDIWPPARDELPARNDQWRCSGTRMRAITVQRIYC